MTGWQNSSILYFGDHLASDIVEANRKVGWRTGCIIKELEREVNVRKKGGIDLPLANDCLDTKFHSV